MACGAGPPTKTTRHAGRLASRARAPSADKALARCVLPTGRLRPILRTSLVRKTTGEEPNTAPARVITRTLKVAASRAEPLNDTEGLLPAL